MLIGSLHCYFLANQSNQASYRAREAWDRRAFLHDRFFSRQPGPKKDDSKGVSVKKCVLFILCYV